MDSYVERFPLEVNRDHDGPVVSAASSRQPQSPKERCPKARSIDGESACKAIVAHLTRGSAKHQGVFLYESSCGPAVAAGDCRQRRTCYMPAKAWQSADTLSHRKSRFHFDLRDLQIESANRKILDATRTPNVMAIKMSVGVRQKVHFSR
jgi:hypothetical protein